MPVTASDIKMFLSGGAANTAPLSSLGGEISETEFVTNQLENLFDNVSGAEALAGSIEYRCVYVVNTHATDDAENIEVFIASQSPNEYTAMAIGLDPAGIGDGTATGVADTIATEDEAPDGVTFGAHPEESSLVPGTGALAAGEAFAVWLRRTVDANAAPSANDPATLRVIGTPAA